MSIAIEISIKDSAIPAIKGVEEGIRNRRILGPIGTAVTLLFQENFLSKGTNKMGWPTTNFWPKAAAATSFQETTDGVTVRVNKQGVRLRLQGGTITPHNVSAVTGRPIKYLTIAAVSEAYGKRASEFDDLIPMFRNRGGKREAYALAQAVQAPVVYRKRTKGAGGNRGVGKTQHTDTVGGRIFFWLVKSVTQEADPTVIPDADKIRETAVGAARNYIDLLMRQEAAKGVANAN